MVNESENTSQMKIEVAYARADKQVIKELMVATDCTIEAAIEASDIRQEFPEINLETSKVGIFGKLSKKTASLKAGDRVEIYRPLIADPKEVRRKREAEGKRMKKGGGDLDGSRSSSK